MIERTRMMKEKIRLSVDEARALSLQVLMRQSVSSAHAIVITDHLMDAALCGYEYSGLPKLLQLINNPKWKNKTTPIAVTYESAMSKVIDGGNHSGMIALEEASNMLIEMAQKTGMAVVGVNNTWMSGRSAYFVEKIARHKLVGLHTVGASDLVTPFGGAKPSLGTNPIAMGFPMKDDPLVIDLSTAAFPGTELDFFALLNRELPSGVALDIHGEPTTDPMEAKKGALLPFGGHKGYALALGFQALAVLAGSERSPNHDYGYFFMAFKPDLLMPLRDYEQSLQTLIDKVKNTPTLQGVDGIRIPGERGQALRRIHQKNGIELDADIFQKLKSLCS
jgi:LDH2 family malate/lactate/ureidoglycolate dehydrogenase